VVQKNELGLEHRSLSSETTLEHAEHLAELLTLSYEPMLAWRLEGPIEFWNAGAERLYGFARNEAVGCNSHALLQTSFPIDFAELRSQLLYKRYWSGELHHVRKDGSDVLVESCMQLFGDGMVLEANRDITERKAIEISLRESEQALRFLGSIVESSDDAIVSKNLDGIITSWNKGVSASSAIPQARRSVNPLGSAKRRTRDSNAYQTR